MEKFIGGNSERIFINLVRGCKCNCTYCYLPSLGINKINERIKASEAEEYICSLSCYQEGQQGTILSVGCYSECMDPDNKEETLKLLALLAKHKNYIQIASKQILSSEDIEKINSLCQYKNQIGIYFSLPTLSHSDKIEIGTPPIESRIDSLCKCSQKDKLYSVLYIKPVLPGITVLDLNQYSLLLKDYSIKCVVGPCFHHDSNGSVMVGAEHFTETRNDDEQIIINHLSKITPCFNHSTEIISLLKEQSKDV